MTGTATKPTWSVYDAYTQAETPWDLFVCLEDRGLNLEQEQQEAIAAVLNLRYEPHRMILRRYLAMRFVVEAEGRPNPDSFTPFPKKGKRQQKWVDDLVKELTESQSKPGEIVRPPAIDRVLAADRVELAMSLIHDFGLRLSADQVIGISQVLEMDNLQHKAILRRFLVKRLVVSSRGKTQQDRLRSFASDHDRDAWADDLLQELKATLPKPMVAPVVPALDQVAAAKDPEAAILVMDRLGLRLTPEQRQALAFWLHLPEDQELLRKELFRRLDDSGPIIDETKFVSFADDTERKQWVEKLLRDLNTKRRQAKAQEIHEQEAGQAEKAPAVTADNKPAAQVQNMARIGRGGGILNAALLGAIALDPVLDWFSAERGKEEVAKTATTLAERLAEPSEAMLARGARWGKGFFQGAFALVGLVFLLTVGWYLLKSGLSIGSILTALVLGAIVAIGLVGVALWVLASLISRFVLLIIHTLVPGTDKRKQQEIIVAEIPRAMREKGIEDVPMIVEGNLYEVLQTQISKDRRLEGVVARLADEWINDVVGSWVAYCVVHGIPYNPITDVDSTAALEIWQRKEQERPDAELTLADSIRRWDRRMGQLTSAAFDRDRWVAADNEFGQTIMRLKDNIIRLARKI